MKNYVLAALLILALFSLFAMYPGNLISGKYRMEYLSLPCTEYNNEWVCEMQNVVNQKYVLVDVHTGQVSSRLAGFVDGNPETPGIPYDQISTFLYQVYPDVDINNAQCEMYLGYDKTMYSKPYYDVRDNQFWLQCEMPTRKVSWVANDPIDGKKITLQQVRVHLPKRVPNLLPVEDPPAPSLLATLKELLTNIIDWFKNFFM